MATVLLLGIALHPLPDLGEIKCIRHGPPGKQNQQETGTPRSQDAERAGGVQEAPPGRPQPGGEGEPAWSEA